MARPRQLAVLCALTVLACAEAPGSDVLVLETAQLRLGARADPPPGDGRWGPVSLPDLWWRARRARAVEGWYRFDFELPADVDDASVTLVSVAQNAAVYLDGRWLGDGGRFDARMPYHYGAPLHLRVPDRLTAGPHVLDVRLRTSPGRPGRLGAVHVGPDAALRPFFAEQELLTRALPRAFAFAAGAIGLLLALVYRGRRDTLAWGWAAGGILCWAISTLILTWPDLPLHGRVREWTNSVVFHSWPLLFWFASRRMLGRRGGRAEIALTATWVAFAVAYALIPHLWTLSLGVVWTVVLLGVGIDLIRLLLTMARTRVVPRGYLLAGAAVAVAALAIYDLVGASDRFSLWHAYSLPIVTLAVGWAFFARVRGAFDESEALNRELETRVEAKSRELESNFVRLSQLESEQAVASERDRLMQDIHDGMGGQLVSTLAMVEGGAISTERVAEALRAALDDLRIMLDSLDPTQNDLLGVLGSLRARLEPRLEGTGLRIDWQVQEVPAVADFGPEKVSHVLRILQESVTNVIKHARASTIVVRTAAVERAGRAGVCVEVADDGQGMAGATAGRGLGHMQRRAEAVGGGVTVTSDGAGTTVRLWLPGAD